MKLEILRDEIRIVPEGAADEAYLKALAHNQDQAKAKLEFKTAYTPEPGIGIRFLVVKPFCCGEGPSRSS